MATAARSKKRSSARRQRRRRLWFACAAGLVALALLIALAVMLARPKSDAVRRGDTDAQQTDVLPTEPSQAPETGQSAEGAEVLQPEQTPEASSDAQGAEDDASMQAPVAEEVSPAPTPEPTPTAAPGTLPDVVSFYRPQGKNYSPRVRLGDSVAGPWKKGKDIGSFEVIASDAELLDGSFFGDIFGKAWKAFPEADRCKIGYTLRYTLDDGSEIRFSMLSPAHIEHTEYIECWLYDDYHQTPHKFYSHLKPSRMKSDTLITSIKLTAGSQIKHVTDIWLTAFICTSLDDFDADRNYIGDTSCTIHILKE